MTMITQREKAIEIACRGRHPSWHLVTEEERECGRRYMSDSFDALAATGYYIVGPGMYEIIRAFDLARRP